jgi:hypothetical protein
MSENLPNETEYCHLADILRSGGRLEIGENRDLGSFARLYFRNTSRGVAKMEYSDLAEVLDVMNDQAKHFAG